METFDRPREASYRADYAVGSLGNVRFGLLLGAILYALFAPLDVWMLPQTWPKAHLIRFALVVPVCLIALALSYHERAKRHLQALVVCFVVCAGLGVVGMILLAHPSEPGFRYYYAGLMLVLIFSFTVVRLRFRPAAFCCVVIIVAYEFVAVLAQHLLAEGWFRGQGPVFINNNFFLVCAGVITLIGAYVLEDYSRTVFRQRDELATALEELRSTQAQLVQSERTRAMAGIVAGLLHELNNPVGAMVSAADIVQRGALRLSAESREHAQGSTVDLIRRSSDALREASERVGQTLQVLKRFSHLDQAETADYDVNAALNDCLTLLAHELGDRIGVEKRFDTVPSIRCSPGEINQLLMNVLKNAVEAIPASGRIEIRTFARDGVAHIEVSDDGVGIPEHRVKDLFVPTFRGESPRVKMGLGLVTSQIIVQRHGGSIRVESSEGVGTRVSIDLPVRGPETGKGASDA